MVGKAFDPLNKIKHFFFQKTSIIIVCKGFYDGVYMPQHTSRGHRTTSRSCFFSFHLSMGSEMELTLLGLFGECLYPLENSQPFTDQR